MVSWATTKDSTKVATMAIIIMIDTTVATSTKIEPTTVIPTVRVNVRVLHLLHPTRRNSTLSSADQLNTVLLAGTIKELRQQVLLRRRRATTTAMSLFVRGVGAMWQLLLLLLVGPRPTRLTGRLLCQSHVLCSSRLWCLVGLFNCLAPRWGSLINDKNLPPNQQ